MATIWLGALVLATVTVFTGHAVWRRQMRKRFLRQRPSLSDTAFCQSVGASAEEAEWWIELRRGLAEQCGLPAEMVAPDDALNTLEDLTFDGWDFHLLLITLEERLNLPVRRLVEENASTAEVAATVRGLGKSLVEALHAHVASLN